MNEQLYNSTVLASLQNQRNSAMDRCAEKDATIAVLKAELEASQGLANESD